MLKNNHKTLPALIVFCVMNQFDKCKQDSYGILSSVVKSINLFSVIILYYNKNDQTLV